MGKDFTTIAVTEEQLEEYNDLRARPVRQGEAKERPPSHEFFQTVIDTFKAAHDHGEEKAGH